MLELDELSPEEVAQNFGRELRVLRASKDRKAQDQAELMGIAPSVLSRHEHAKQNIPNRQTLLEWCTRLKLTWDEELPLFVAAQMLPRTPKGFGRDEILLLFMAFRELSDLKAPEGSMDFLRNTMDQLWRKQLQTEQPQTQPKVEQPFGKEEWFI